MSITHQEYVGRALGLVAAGLEPFVEQGLRPHLHPTMSWTDLIARRDEMAGRGGRSYSPSDLQVQLRALTETLGQLGHPFDTQLGRTGNRLAGELRDARNDWAHNNPFSGDDAYRVLDTAQRLLTIVGADEQARVAADLRRELHARILDEERTVLMETAPVAVEAMSAPDPVLVPLEAEQLVGTSVERDPFGAPASPPSSCSLHESEEPLIEAELPVGVSISSASVISYAMAHNHLSVISDVTLMTSDVTVRGAKLSVGIHTAEGALGEPREYFVDLAAGAETLVPRLDMTVDPSAMLVVEEARPARVVATVTHEGRVLGRRSIDVQLLAAHQWLAQPVLMSLEMLAAHVQPNHPALASVIDDASTKLERVTGRGGFFGYQQGPERVDETVDAVIAAIRAREIRYSMPPASWSDDGQKVRTPDEVLQGRLGTCLDTAVTLAAALERVGIRPLLVVVEGHAFLGYWREEASLASPATTGGSALVNLVHTGYVQLVETTMLTTDHREATIHDIKRRPLELHLTGDLDQVVGVADVYQARMSRIYPLPARTEAADGTVSVVEYQAVHSRPDAYVGADRPATGARDAASVPPRVQRWKNSLLDLSLRNGLINFSDRARYPLGVADEGLAEFEDILNEGKSIELLPSDALPAVDQQRGIRRGRDLAADDRIQLFRSRRQVYTDSSAESYQRAMRMLAYKAKTVLDETGANNLYISIGSLVWKVKDRALRSPLILVPVTLKPKVKGGAYMVTLDEAGVSTPNYCLLEKLRAEHGLSIPALSDPAMDGSGIDITATLTAVREAILSAGLDAHVEATVDLAVLQFAKFRLWKDLDENWEALAGNALVRHLIETPTDPFLDPALPSGDPLAEGVEPDLDALLAELPVSADSSQLAAVAAATAGRTFVLEGPPGTGKSQTITNLLAKAIADGRKVLFVAEKRAALEVVQRRLASVGLAPFTLDLHDKGSKPAALREHLRTALAQKAIVDRDGMARSVSGMEAARRRLARYATQVHEPNLFGQSLYAARNAELGTSEFPCLVTVSDVFAGAATSDDLHTVRSALRELPDHLGRVRPSENHGWSFIDLEAGRALDIADVEERVRALDVALNSASGLPSLVPLIAAASTPEDLITVAGVLRSEQVDLATLEAVRSDHWRSRISQVRMDIDGLRAAFGDVLAVAGPGVLHLDVDGIAAAAAAAHSSSVFGRKKRNLAVLQSFSHVLHPGVSVPLAELHILAGRFVMLRDAARQIADRLSALAGFAPAPTWNPLEYAEREYIGRQSEWLSWLAESTNPRVPGATSFELRDALQTHVTSPHSVDASAVATATDLATAMKRLRDAPGTTTTSWAAWCPDGRFFDRWTASRDERDSGTTRGVSLAGWIRWLVALEPLRAAGLDEARRELLTGRVPADEAYDAFDRGLATASRIERARSTGLDEFDVVSQERNIERYTASARETRGHLPQAIPTAVLGRRSFTARSAQGRAGKLVAEIGKLRGRLSVRDFMSEYGDLITEITPCVLVSPDSVARFFPAKGGLFDIVVFDEASQVRVADAVGAMGRATSVVVVGDSKQMPPTSFAESAVDDEDDEEALVAEVLARDEESILAECKQARIESRWLSWHYRSQDESLIAFSNRAYYEDQLTSFPAPAHGTVDEGAFGHGIALRRVNGRFLRSGKGASLRTNPVEADAIVAEIRSRFEAQPDSAPSLGVVTFNAQQRTLIETMLRDLGDDRILDALDSEADGLFVKNLENVQGDERDTILFSTAFSKNDKGVLPLNFGPLTNFGGERRLNVAITRARRQVIMFSSFDPADLRAEETSSRGIRDLRAYLELAERGAEHVLGVSTALRTSDLHREDVAEALRARGFEVRTDVGLSDFKVDIAVAPAGHGEAPTMAVLLDGPAWSSRRTVADRDALPLEVLNGLMHWPAVARVWLPEWIRDRETVLDRLVAAVPDTSTNAASSASMPASPVEIDIQRAAPLPVVDVAMTDLRSGHPALATIAPPTTIQDDEDPNKPFEESLEGRASVLASFAPAAPLRRADRNVSAERGVTFVPWQAWRAGEKTVLDTLHDPESQREVRKVIKEVVRDEGPVTEARLVKLVAGSFGLQRVHEDRKRAVLRLVPNKFRRDDDPGVFWPHELGPRDWNGFRVSGAVPERSLEAVPLEEIANALIAQATSSWADAETLLRTVLALFGGHRMTAAIEQRLKDARQRAENSGRLEFDRGTGRIRLGGVQR